MVYVLDIGGTFTKYAHIENGIIVNCGKWKTQRSLDILLELIDKNKPDKIEYIAVSSGGFWKNDGTCDCYPTLPCTADGSFLELLRKKYNCKVYIENDARCALLGEAAEEKKENAVMFVLGSSLGCAAMVDGRIVKGHKGQAGAMYMMPELLDGEKFVFDSDANSIAACKQYAEKKGLLECYMLDIETDAENGDIDAERLLKKYTAAVAVKCVYAYLMYDPECIILGGGIANGENIINSINKKANVIAEKIGYNGKIIMKKARLGENSNIFGAYRLGKADK